MTVQDESWPLEASALLPSMCRKEILISGFEARPLCNLINFKAYSVVCDTYHIVI